MIDSARVEQEALKWRLTDGRGSFSYTRWRQVFAEPGEVRGSNQFRDTGVLRPQGDWASSLPLCKKRCPTNPMFPLSRTFKSGPQGVGSLRLDPLEVVWKSGIGCGIVPDPWVKRCPTLYSSLHFSMIKVRPPAGSSSEASPGSESIRGVGAPSPPTRNMMCPNQFPLSTDEDSQTRCPTELPLYFQS